MKLSAVIITLNEEENIAKVLASVKNFAEEIIIVDSGSTDKTLEIVKKYGAKIYHRKFDDFASQKNWAQDKASGNWIFSLDADERVSEDLAREIKQAIQSNEYIGYFISRRNFILGEEIKHSRWSPDQHIWLWKKGLGKWMGKVHEEVIINGLIGQLKESKIHYSHKTVSEFFKSNNFYSTLLAGQMFENGIKFQAMKILWDPLFEFFIRFIVKMGFLDRWRGFMLAYLMAIYKISVWVKLYELQNTGFKK